MTNPSPEPPHRPRLTTRISELINSPALLIGGGIVVGLGMAGYLGLRYWVYRQLPAFLEAQLGQTLQRPVNIGLVEEFSLNHLRLGRSQIPPTPTDADRISLEGVTVGWNPFPLLWGQPLGIKITIDSPDLYLDQAPAGKWIKIVRVAAKAQEPPIGIDANIRLKNANIALKPDLAAKPITLEAEGQVNYLYRSSDRQRLSYDLDTRILNNPVAVKGYTVPNTGQSQIALQIKQLNLQAIAGLFTQSPVQLKQGTVNAQVNASLPSLDAIAQTQGLGKINLQQIQAQIAPLKAPLQLDLALNLQGQTILVEQLRASIGKLKAEVKGRVNWQKGYDLQAKVNPLPIEELPKIFPFSYPFPLSGAVEAQMQITGKIDKPLIKGTLQNSQLLKVDRIPLKSLRTAFQADLNQITFNNAQIQPLGGGKLLAKGRLGTQFLRSLKAQKPIDWLKMPLDIKFEAVLPTQSLIMPYYRPPNGVELGTITAEGQIKGTAAKLLSIARWRSADLVTLNPETFTGSGEIRWQGYTVTLNDTVLNSAGGQVRMAGIANFQSQQWQGELMANRFALSPLLPVACSLANCPPNLRARSLVLKAANIQLQGSFAALTLDRLQGQANFDLAIDDGTVAVQSRLNDGNLQAQTVTHRLNLSPFLPTVAAAVQVDRAKVKVTGSIASLLLGDRLDLNRLNVDFDADLAVDRRPLSAKGTLIAGQIQTIATTRGLALNPFLPQVTFPLRIDRGKLDLKGSLASLLAGDKLDLRQLKATFDADLALANHPITTTGSLSQGQLSAIANAQNIPLRAIANSLPFPATLKGGSARIAGDIQSVIASLASNRLDTRSLSANANGIIDTKGGRIIALAQLENNQLQASVSSRKLDLKPLLRPFTNSQFLGTLAPVDSQVTISSNLDALLTGKSDLPLSLDRFEISSGRQALSAQGSILLTQLLGRPDIAQAKLQVNAKGHLDDLPLSEFLALLPARQDFLPQQIALTGNGRFQGQLLAKNLLSAPQTPGSLQLKGKVNLNDFAFNDRAFEPRLQGTLDFRLGGDISLDLRGKQDILLASLSPCTRPQCPAPYLPATIELRQTYGTEQPIIAQVDLKGDRLIGRIEQFPLALLRLAPGKTYGIPGYLDGTIYTDFAINPYSLEGEGSLRLDRPRIGRVEAQSLNARLAFAHQIARLQDAQLQLGESLYKIDGALNLRTGGIEGNLAINNGQIQDILNAVQVSDVDSLLTLLQFRPLPPVDIATLTPNRLGSPQATIAELVNLLAQVDQKIRERARQLERGGTPTALDLRGQFDAQIKVGGTLKSPTAQASLEGNRWAWHPFVTFPNIVEPLGLVLNDAKAIPIEQLTMQASLDKGILSLDPIRLNIRETEIAIAGQVGLEGQTTNTRFRVKNLSLDTIGSMVRLPIDASGQISVVGEIGGTLREPTVAGKFDFVEGALNARSLNLTLEGEFSYTDHRFRLATTQPSSLSVYLDAPFPPTANNNEANLKLRLDTPALGLIGALTQDQLTWLGGEGSVLLDGKVRFNPGNLLSFNAIANGKVAFQNALIKSAALPHPLTVNGEAQITQEGITVDHIEGQFDESQLLIAGFLPLFKPPTPVTNPLSIQIEKGQVNIENLYRGQIDANVVLRGSILSPIIGGDVQLAKGEVSIPQTKIQRGKVVEAYTRWSKTNPLRKSPPVRPQLDHFQVALRDLAIEQLPFYRFKFGGDLVLNGTLDSLQTIRPQGSILVDQGRVSFFDTRFLIDRRHPNQIVFDPVQGLLNPQLNLRMRTIVSELPASKRQRSADSNEIPDDSITKIQRVDIGLSIQGSLSQILPNLDQNAANICQTDDNLQIIATGTTFTQLELDRLTKCVDVLVAQDAAYNPLLNNASVRLTSSPPRSQGEIVRLLAEQFIVLADALEGGNAEQLLRVGIVQLALPMVFQGVVYDLETAISNGINSKDFRVVPFLEAIYEVDKEGFVRLSYDYSINEVRVRYEKRF